MARTISAAGMYNGREETRYRRITFADNGATVTVCIVPKGGVVTDAGIVVTTVFNGTPPVLDIGPTSDTDGIATDLVLSTAGVVPADELDSTDDLGPYADDTAIVGVLSSGSNVTTGEGYIYVRFLVPIAS